MHKENRQLSGRIESFLHNGSTETSEECRYLAKEHKQKVARCPEQPQLHLCRLGQKRAHARTCRHRPKRRNRERERDRERERERGREGGRVERRDREKERGSLSLSSSLFLSPGLKACPRGSSPSVGGLHGTTCNKCESTPRGEATLFILRGYNSIVKV